MRVPHSKPTLSRAEEAAVIRVLRSRRLAGGPEVRRFENAVARATGTRHGVAVSSGTAALLLLLEAIGVEKGDEILLPSFACSSFLSAVQGVGATPSFVDIRPDDFTLDPAAARRARSRRTRLVIATHQFGYPAAIEELRGLGVPVVEAGAQALGGRVGGRPIGGLGDAAFFSFYATKLLTTAEGGMVVTNRPAWGRGIRELREYDEKSDHQPLVGGVRRPRFNYKMSDLSAALGMVQLKRLPRFLAMRSRLARAYTRGLAGTPGLLLPPDIEGQVWYRYVVRCATISTRTRLMTALARAGIEAKVPLFRPLHRLLGIPDREFPVTTSAWRTILSLPLYPSLTLRDVNMVVRTIQGSV